MAPGKSTGGKAPRERQLAIKIVVSSPLQPTEKELKETYMAGFYSQDEASGAKGHENDSVSQELNDEAYSLEDASAVKDKGPPGDGEAVRAVGAEGYQNDSGINEQNVEDDATEQREDNHCSSPMESLEVDKQNGTATKEVITLSGGEDQDVDSPEILKLKLRSEIEKLQKEREELRSDNNKLMEEKATFNKGKALLESEIESLSNDKTILGNDTEFLNKEKTKLQSALELLNIETSTVQGDVNSLNGKKTILESEIESLSNVKTGLRDEKNKLQNDIELLNKKKDKFLSHIKILDEKEAKMVCSLMSRVNNIVQNSNIPEGFKIENSPEQDCLSVKKSLAGRQCIRPLEFWRGEKVIYNKDREIVGYQEGTSSSYSVRGMDGVLRKKRKV